MLQYMNSKEENNSRCAVLDSAMSRMNQDHRVSTAREEKGWGPRFFRQKNLTDPAVQYRASTTVKGCQSDGLGHLLQYMREYNAKSPKQVRKRFNSTAKTIHFSYLPIIYLWSGWSSIAIAILKAQSHKKPSWVSIPVLNLGYSLVCCGEGYPLGWSDMCHITSPNCYVWKRALYVYAADQVLYI